MYVVLSEDEELWAGETIFGWAIGRTSTGGEDVVPPTPVCLQVSLALGNVDKIMQQLWEIEKIPGEAASLTPDEERAIKHFQTSHSCDPDGQYRVALHRKEPAPELGRSREAAKQWFEQNKRSLQTKSCLEPFYAAMAEYQQLQHAETVPKELLHKYPSCCYYSTIHGVVKMSSLTT